jgi:hypothetical protein
LTREATRRIRQAREWPHAGVLVAGHPHQWGDRIMKRLVASLSIVSLLAIGCSGTPTAPLFPDSMNPGALLNCGSNTNNANNPPATAGSCGTNNTNNNTNANNNPPVTAKN